MKSKRKIIPAQAQQEIEVYLWSVSHSLLHKTVEVYCGPGTDDGPDVTQCKRVVIGGEDYAELMQAAPDWAPGKPAGTFRDDDLLEYVDLVGDRQAVREKAARQAVIDAEAEAEKSLEIITKQSKAQKAEQKEFRKQARAARAFDENGNLISGSML